LKEWRKEATLAEKSGHRLVLEDGSELSGSSEGSGDEESMEVYTKGCGTIDGARLTKEQAQLLQAHGRTEVLGTASAAGRQEV
jgi:glycine/D-amino acid oxidase-like deaminating enzyme